LCSKYISSLDKKIAIYFELISKSTVLAGVYITRQHCGSGGGERAPQNKDSHL
jgi:hypothetical protein